MLNKKVGAYGEVWGEDFVLSDTWCLSNRGSIAFGRWPNPLAARSCYLCLRGCLLKDPFLPVFAK